MRWHRSDEVPEDNAKCLCKCKRGTDDTVLMVLTAHVYYDSSGEVQILIWYDEVEGGCFGDWEPEEVLGWCSLSELEAELDKGEG